MPEVVSTVLAKALVMLVQALLARLIIQFMRAGLHNEIRAAFG